MIHKLIRIENLGRFHYFVPTGEAIPVFKKTNIIYSENGRGKSTLASTFRSIKDQNGDILLGRRTLGATTGPIIHIIRSSTQPPMTRFEDGKWINIEGLKIEIFDSTFVRENVFSYTIEHEHKKNLYQFTIGEQGVALAQRMVMLDDKLRENNKIHKEFQKLIESQLNGVEIKKFLGFQHRDEIDLMIKDQENKIDSLKKVELIKAKPAMKKIIMPNFDRVNFQKLLLESLDQLMDDVEKLTKRHIDLVLGEGGEEWLEFGVRKCTDEKCPFCGQDIKHNKLIHSFRSHFNVEYAALKKRIGEMEQNLLRLFSNDIFFKIQQTISENDILLQFWREHISISHFLKVQFKEFKDGLTGLLNATLDLIRIKQQMPLESVQFDVNFNGFFEQYQQILFQTETYNIQIEQVNNQILTFKDELKIEKLAEMEDILNLMKHVVLRYTPKVKDQCDNFIRMQKEIGELKNEKELAKDQLDKYSKGIFATYETSINRHLENFGADFRVDQYNSSFIGGKPSSSYTFKINNIQVQIGTSDTPLNKASFKNTLSEGDKSSLAFSFFLAKMDQEILEDKIVVFDDPISSLDLHRKNYTASTISEIAVKAKQTFVLTHDLLFTKLIWDQIHDKSQIQQISIVKKSTIESKLSYWSIEEATQEEYFINFRKLSDFLNYQTESRSDLLGIKRCIRPLLEGNLRVRFPEYLSKAEWLGDLIKKLRGVTQGHPLYVIAKDLPDLEEINDYCKGSHHSAPQFKVENINETELESYVRRTVQLLGG